MAKINETELKRVVSANRSLMSPWHPGAIQRPRMSKNRRAAGKMLDGVLAKAGLDVGKLDKLLAQDRSEQRSLFHKQKAEAAKHSAAAAAVWRAGMAARANAVGLLSKPFVSTFIPLNTPFLIWQLPHPQLNIFIDQHVEAMNNWIKILIDTNSGSDSTEFVFYFMWQNPSQYDAIINVSSSLTFNGSCEVDAAAGFFSGDSAYLDLGASLTVMRWSGWGTDPATGQSNDQTFYPDYQPTQYQSVARLSAEGSALYISQGVDTQGFSFQPFALSESFVIVPGGAVTLFEITLNLSYGFDDGGNISDLVSVDFSSGGNAVFCPQVLLELLTQPANVAVA